jgi:hypothetical protein
MLRYHVIDALRGFCLLNIFINHITLGALHEASISKLGLSDTAEVFVFLAGISVYLYADRDWSTSRIRLLRRASRLYAVNVGIILATIAVLYLIDEVNGDTKPYDADTLSIFAKQTPMEIIASIVLFSQSYGYSMVLRLYTFLMLWSPIALWLARKRFWYPLVPAVVVWVCAGHFDLVVRNRFTNEPFALTLLPWTLVFTAGIAFGAGLAKGITMPRSRTVTFLAAFLVIGYVVLVNTVVPHWPAAQAWFETRNAHFWLGGSKTYQSPARMLHLLCCIYLFVVARDLPVIRLFYTAREENLLCRLGRASLPVFAVGAVASVMIDEVIYLVAQDFGLRSPAAIAVEFGLAACGFAAMVFLADRIRRSVSHVVPQEAEGLLAVVPGRSESPA